MQAQTNKQTDKFEYKDTKDNNMKHILKHENIAILCVFVAYVILVTCVNPKFLSWMNIRNVLVQVSITGILSLGMLMVMLSGGIDLSIAWMMTFFGCSTSYLMVKANWPVSLTIVVVVIGSVFMQGLMGYIISRTKIEPFIITLGFMSIYQSFTYLITDGSEIGADKHLQWLNQFPLGISTLVYIFVVLAVIVYLILRFTKFGRRIFAVGCNPIAAYLSGVDVKNLKMVVYMINGLLIAIASILQVARLNTASPSMGLGQEINAIAACVVGGTALSGGKGNLIGVVIGVLLLGSVKNSMTIMFINPYVADFLKGLIIVVSVVIGQAAFSRNGSSKRKGVQKRN